MMSQKKIITDKDSKYSYIPIETDDEPSLVDYGGKHKKNEEARSREGSGGSQMSISRALVSQNADRPDPKTDKWTTIPKGWDIFRLLPPPPDNLKRGLWYDVSLQVLKISCFFVLFFTTLCSAIIAKGAFLLMTSAIGTVGTNFTVCSDKIPESPVNEVEVLPQHVVKWIWSAYISLCVPEVLCFVGCIHRAFFRNIGKPTFIQFTIVFIIETFNAVAVGILVFKILPNLDAITGAMLTNFACFVPNVLLFLSRRLNRMAILLMMVDVGCIIAQIVAFWILPDINGSFQQFAFILPLCLVLVSISYWQNFVHISSAVPLIRVMARFAVTLSERRSKTYMFISPWKCFVYLLMVFVVLTKDITLKNLFEEDPFEEKLLKITARHLNRTQISKFYDRMQRLEKEINIEKGNNLRLVETYSITKKEHENNKRTFMTNMQEKREFSRRRNRQAVNENEYKIPPNTYDIYDDYVVLNQYSSPYDAFWVVLIQSIAVFLTYNTSKFACKVMMQRICFALPITLSVPTTIAVLHITCTKRLSNVCHSIDFLPKEIFWKCNAVGSLSEFILSPTTQIWLTALAVQLWITSHLWTPRQERLAKTAKLFVLPHNSALFTDLSLALNRRCDDQAKIRTEDLEFDTNDLSKRDVICRVTHAQRASSISNGPNDKVIETVMIREIASSVDAVTKIYVCATMWHETAVEMTCMLKSIFRMDEDQCARRNAQKYLKVIDPDYYEFEAHIFFDDAFDINDYDEPVLNKYVQQLIEKVDEAASGVHQTQIRLRPPKKITTPYGGRLNFIMPGKNRLTIHLKDKRKIRMRKRWSQVMYLYYLLGYQLMMKVDDEIRKEVISENTYILSLDGDVDFSPQCVHLLVDLMKKDRRLGAACGRIHPRGSGLMVWYQKFEYAIGHWLQKATEHMIGCVLCSPGCFSLFRSLALMDDNVTRRYASKYDQGEDRWLCTLLLQRGYRVEYCAASDALTYAPESFNEFFNQRRRWIPSTLANIIDLLQDYKNVINVNESISIWYILYQCIMLVSSILGPGTVFLMVLGALSISVNIDTAAALFIVTLPISLFCLLCFISNSEKQLIAAQIIGALFAMLMTAVIVGTVVQIQKEGIMSPHAIFLLAVFGSFFIAALLHPLEFKCILPGILYFLAIPCMCMLLPIYSLCNLNTVAWGTRENPIVKANDGERQKCNKHFDIVNDKTPKEMNGEISVGCGTACRLLCCLKENELTEIVQIRQLNEKMDKIVTKLDQNEWLSGIKPQAVYASAANNCGSAKWTNGTNGSQTEIEDDRYMTNQLVAAMRSCSLKIRNTWLNDECMRRAKTDYLDPDEEVFWDDIISKYLTPIVHDQLEEERIKSDLLVLRNKVCSGFFMVNIVFVITVLLLQLQKDCIHIEWPIGPRYNHTIIPCNADSREPLWMVTRLQLEPIGLVFLLFFISILIIQFMAMLFHRFGTMAHIIASTELFCWHKRISHLTEDELVVQNAVEIARELQAIRGVDEAVGNMTPTDQIISRRNIVHHLESSKCSRYRPKTQTLDAAFRKRFFALSSNKTVDRSSSDRRLTLRRNTIRAIERRRNSIFGTQQPNEDEELTPTIERQWQERTEMDRSATQRTLQHLFDDPVDKL